MRYSIKNFLPVVALLLATSCHTPYRLISVDRTRVLVDNRYDAKPDAQAAEFLKPYERQVDEKMSPVVGSTAHPMRASRPEIGRAHD